MVSQEEWVTKASCPGCFGTGSQGGNPLYGDCDDCRGRGYIFAPYPPQSGAVAWEVIYADGSGYLGFTEEDADQALAEAPEGGTKSPLYASPSGVKAGVTVSPEMFRQIIADNMIAGTDSFPAINADGLIGDLLEAFTSPAALAVGDEGMGDGWIEWTGGDCPIDPDAWVEAKLRYGGPTHLARGAGLSWKHGNIHGPTTPSDIIAYRLALREREAPDA